MKNLFISNSFSNIGQREINEDCVFPNVDIPSKLENLFLVCDGVGGLNKGEDASDLCCTQFSGYFTQNNIEISNKSTIDKAVKFVEKKFDSFMTNNPQSMDMASTITLLHLHKQGATIAHMGDSRVYHFRNGEILFKTKDHSVVQDLFDAGVISEEEMHTHRDRNRISRAMRGASVKSYKADTTVLTDIKVDDIFFLCTDGVLESFSDTELKELFASTNEVETINAKIMRKCIDSSRDNFSGYTIKVNKEYIDTLKPIEEVETDKDKATVTQIIVEEQTETKENKTQIQLEESDKTQIIDSNVKTPKDEAEEQIIKAESSTEKLTPEPEHLHDKESKGEKDIENKADVIDNEVKELEAEKNNNIKGKTELPIIEPKQKVEEDKNIVQDQQNKEIKTIDPLKEVNKNVESDIRYKAKPKPRLNIKLIGLVVFLLGLLLGGYLGYNYFFNNKNKSTPAQQPQVRNNISTSKEDDSNTLVDEAVNNNNLVQSQEKERLERERQEKERLEKEKQKAKQETAPLLLGQNNLLSPELEINKKKVKADSLKNNNKYVEAITILKTIEPKNEEVEKIIKDLEEKGNDEANKKLEELLKITETPCSDSLKNEYKTLSYFTTNQEILKQIPCK